ncbi:MAG: hypothetical protein KGY69_16520 [Bacteroidales bacterium]|nr:hypothetical protein [Bacteroidales bacterium]
MKKQIITIFMALGLLGLSCTQEKETKQEDQFPEVSGPVQLTDGPEEHLFASYYGINSWSADQRFATVLETDIRHSLPTENDPATLGMIDMETKKFIPLTKTRAWNFQQGCMAHWLGSSPDSLIVFNDLRDGRFVSVVMNVHSKEEVRTLPFPVSAVAPDGKKAVSINFSRLRITREDYGYGGQGQNPLKNERFPEDDGLFLVDLETGDKELLVSIADIQEMVPEIPEDGLEYFNHTLFSKDGSKIMWLARAIPERNTTAFVVEREGSNLQKCFPEGWGGSHFDWLNGDTLMITANYKEEVYSHVMFTAGRKDYQRLGGGLLDYDGHGTFSPNGEWFITDTYPNGLREQQLFLMNMDNQAVLPLGRFHQPSEYRSGWRCDLHPRWSPDSDMVGFNSTHSGLRQVYVIHFSH